MDAVCIILEGKRMKDYRINWLRVFLVGAIAVVLVLIGIVIGVNIGNSKKNKPVLATRGAYSWRLEPGEQAGLIDANFWNFARASYVLIGEIPNCQFYKIVKEIPRNDYNVENFRMDEGTSTVMRYYNNDGTVASSLAVDVSAYQSDLDWNLLRQAGVTIAFIRVGFRGYGAEGNIKEDDMFRSHMEGAKAAGMRVGIYFFSQAVSYDEGVAEAQFALRAASEYGIDMPIVIDTEELLVEDARTADLSVDARTDAVVGFCETVKNAGYAPMIYSNRNWFVQNLDLTRLGDYKLWLAQYSNQPDFPYVYAGWQYTGTGTIEGLGQEIDMNVWFE